MLAALGVVIPEILDLLGAFHFVEPVWWRVGYSKLKVSVYHLYIYLLRISFKVDMHLP